MFVKIGNWFKNYWYYYKWPVIIGGAFVLIITICLVQCSTKEDYDLSILYTGPHVFSQGEKSDFNRALAQLMDDDVNKDGKKNVDIIDLTAYSDEQIREEIGTDSDEATLIKYASYTIDNVKGSFAQVASKGDVSICFLDEYWYNILLDAGHLVPLEEILGFKPEFLRDDYSAYISELKVYSLYGDSFGKLPEDTVICFRKMAVTSALTGRNEVNKTYEASKRLIVNIFELGGAQ
jgi:hypothetical protein